jgi:hypothetical protein
MRAGIAERLKQSAQGRLLSYREFSREQCGLILLILNWLLRAKYHAFWKRVLRLIGVGAAGVGQEWIAVTSAATAGGHSLALLHGLKAAGAHSGSDVLAAILTRARRRRRCHRDKRQCEKRRNRRGGHLQKLFHLVLPVLALAPKSTHGMAITPAPSSRKNSNGILSRVREKIENHRNSTVLKYDHHSNGWHRAVLTGFDEHKDS